MTVCDEAAARGIEWRLGPCVVADWRLADVLALEYGHLKEEQRARIATRDSLVYTTLAAQALLAGTALTSGRPEVLLLIPFVCVVLGWTRMLNDQKITHIRRYIDGSLRPQLQARLEGTVLGWELAHRTGTQYRIQKAGQLLVDLLLYGASSLAASVVAVGSSDSPAIVVAVAAAECVLGATLGLLLIRAADLPRWPLRGADDF